MSSWLKWVKFLCWTGWHIWEYLYSGDGEKSNRTCKRCGVEQSNLSGKWK